LAQKVKVSAMLTYYYPHAVKTNSQAPSNPPKDQYGYVMGGNGTIATDEYLRQRAKSSYPLSWKSHYKDTLKWLGRRVVDCNAVAEYFYRSKTGVNIDTKARLNYANWCSKKSSKKPDRKLKGLPQMPGVAVFSGGISASGITHVGYLLYKYGSGDLDWYVLEARGRNYGVVITKLTKREWRYWGVMDKYFEYDLKVDWNPIAGSGGGSKPVETKLVFTRILKCILENNVYKYRGEDVKTLQKLLIDKGYKITADGIFGEATETAVKAFQKSKKLTVDGVVGKNTVVALGGVWNG
jgi:hypothetical protein